MISAETVRVYKVAYNGQSRRYFGKRGALRWLAVRMAKSKQRWQLIPGVNWIDPDEFAPVLKRFIRRYWKAMP